MPEFAFSNGELLAAKYHLKADLTRSYSRELARDAGDYIVNAARGILAQHTRRGMLARGVRRSAVVRVGDIYSTSIGVRNSAARYASWVEYGTGMHIDPRVGTPHLIYPKTASRMVWKETGANAIPYQGAGISAFQIRGGHKIVAQYTRGQKPVHYMRDAFRLADKTYIPGRLSVLGKLLSR